jgi:spermidine synthase
MKPFIYPEMMVHVPLCTHKAPHNVLIISNHPDALLTETARHSDLGVKVVSSDSVIEAVRNEADHSMDVILLEGQTDAAGMAHINRVLKTDGLMVLTHPSLDDEAANKALMSTLGSYFKIIMPYYVGDKTLLLASKEYHPTADIILQRTDLLEGQQFYNCDVHPAVFAMPNYIRKMYLGSIRN